MGAGILSPLDYIGADARTALVLVFADQLYIDRLCRADDDLEKFVRSVVPTSTLDGIQPYFEVNVCIPLTSVNTFNSHPLTAYNIYYNKFIVAYGLFKAYFEEKLVANSRATMKAYNQDVPAN